MSKLDLSYSYLLQKYLWLLTFFLSHMEAILKIIVEKNRWLHLMLIRVKIKN